MNNNSKIIIERFVGIRNKLEKGLPLLLIESTILSSILNIDGYDGVEMVNMFKNSTSITGERSFRESTYFSKILEILDAVISGKERIFITDSVKDTVSFTSPITVSVPSSTGDNKIEIQTIPYIGVVSTNEPQIIEEYRRLTEDEGYAVSEITPLECIFSDNVDNDIKIKFIKTLFLMDTRTISSVYTSQDDFFSIYDESDGFIIKYGLDKYLVVGDKNSKETEEGKDTIIFTLEGDDLRAAEVSALDMIFYT